MDKDYKSHIKWVSKGKYIVRIWGDSGQCFWNARRGEQFDKKTARSVLVSIILYQMIEADISNKGPKEAWNGLTAADEARLILRQGRA